MAALLRLSVPLVILEIEYYRRDMNLVGAGAPRRTGTQRPFTCPPDHC